MLAEGGEGMGRRAGALKEVILILDVQSQNRLGNGQVQQVSKCVLSLFKPTEWNSAKEDRRY